MDRDQGSGEERDEILISISADGRVTKWSIRKGFECTGKHSNTIAKAFSSVNGQESASFPGSLQSPAQPKSGGLEGRRGTLKRVRS